MWREKVFVRYATAMREERSILCITHGVILLMHLNSYLEYLEFMQFNQNLVKGQVCPRVVEHAPLHPKSCEETS